MIIDNNSTYQPLLQYYKTLKNSNKNPGRLFSSHIKTFCIFGSSPNNFFTIIVLSHLVLILFQNDFSFVIRIDMKHIYENINNQ